MEGTRALVAIIDAQLMVKKQMSNARTEASRDLFVSQSGALVGQFPRLFVAKISANLT